MLIYDGNSGVDNTEQCFPFGLTSEQISQLDSTLSTELQTVYSDIQVLNEGNGRVIYDFIGTS